MLVLALSVALIWRLPSLFDPPWVNDEGTYFAIAQALAHGYRLYVDIWENKPPGVYLLYSAVYHLFGPSLVAVRVLTTLVALALVLLTFRIALVLADAPAAGTAATLTGLLLGVPFLEGTTGNAEIFLAVLSALAVYLALARGRAALSGPLMAGAVLFKAVGGFDAAALGLWLLLNRRRAAFIYTGTLGAALLALLAAAWLAGILPAMIRDAFLYDLGYVGSKNGGGLPWLLLLKLVALAAATLWLRRAPFPVLWLVYASTGALISGRPFGHYALQAVAPLSVCVALLLRGRERLAVRLRVALPAASLLGAVLLALVGWSMAAAGHDSILARRLQWYANFARLVLRTESYATYRAQVDDHVNRNLRIVGALSTMPSGRILVWGNVPWVYVLSGRLPATPYTSALRDPAVPGETEWLRTALAAHRPREVVVVRPPLPPLGHGGESLRRWYRPAGTIDGATIYVSAPDRAAR